MGKMHPPVPGIPLSVLLEWEREASDRATPPARLAELAGERYVQHLVAANRKTPIDVLDRLRRVPRRAVRAAVAANPNTPFELLRALLPDYPAEVLGNPVWRYLLLERPGLAEQLTEGLSAEAAAGMLRFASLPRVMVNPLTRSADDGVRHLAARHVALVATSASGPVPTPDELAHVRSAFHSAIQPLGTGDAEPLFALRGLVAVDFLDLLIDTPFVEFIACCPDAPARLLDRLPLKGKTRVAQYVAAHRHARPELLGKLIEVSDHNDHNIKIALAGNPRSPASVLRWLALDESADVRWRVAASAQADDTILHHLAQDRKWDVRMVAARHPNIAASDLRSLSYDPEAQVRVAAERSGILERLSRYVRNPDPLVRRALAAHPNVTPGLLELLADDWCENVRVQVARHPRVSERLIEQLAVDEDPAVRSAAAEHPRLAASRRRDLELDAVLEVRQHLPRNPNTPFATLRRLWAWASAEQRRIIMRHPALTPERRVQLYARIIAPHLRRMDEAPTLARLAALSSPLLPGRFYAAAARSRFWLDRFVVASNPAAPVAILEALASDGISYIRVAALATLATSSSARSAT